MTKKSLDAKTRPCERCHYGTETAVTNTIYTCDTCDRGEIESAREARASEKEEDTNPGLGGYNEDLFGRKIPGVVVHDPHDYYWGDIQTHPYPFSTNTGIQWTGPGIHMLVSDKHGPSGPMCGGLENPLGRHRTNYDKAAYKCACGHVSYLDIKELIP